MAESKQSNCCGAKVTGWDFGGDIGKLPICSDCGRGISTIAVEVDACGYFVKRDGITLCHCDNPEAAETIRAALEGSRE